MDHRVGMIRHRDLAGQKFGRWTVVERAGRNKHRMALWRVRCECGAEAQIHTSALTAGNSRSCGCLHRDVITDHGKSDTPAYTVWSNMLSRCEDHNEPSFARYGARGITVCDRWHDFEAFLDDMGQPPEGKTLERIDNAGPYAPENCRWATRMEQARNRRTSLMIEFLGQTKSLAEWCEVLCLDYQATWKKLRRRGMSVDAVFRRLS